MHRTRTFMYGVTREEYTDEAGLFHREDGAALITTTPLMGPGLTWPPTDSGLTAWYIHGKLHREDGPAIESPDYNAWFLNGEKIKVVFKSGIIFQPGP